jgi:hypothetical protein
VSRRLGLAAVACCLPLIAACGSMQDAMGLSKRSPDEFAVVRRQPLIIPPDYGLRPPQPGEVGPQLATAGDRTRAALTGRDAPASAAAADGLLAEPATTGRAPSEGEAALITRAGGQAAGSGPSLAERVLAAPAGSAGAADGALDVLSRAQTPIEDLQE